MFDVGFSRCCWDNGNGKWMDGWMDGSYVMKIVR